MPRTVTKAQRIAATPLRQRRQGRAIVWHLAVFGAGLLVPAFIFVAVLMWQVAASERARYETAARAAAQDIAYSLDAELSGLLSAARVLATDPGLARDLPSFEERARAALPVDAAHVVLVDQYGGILAHTADGATRGGAPTPLGVELHDLALHGRSVSNVFSDQGTRFFAVRAPVPANQAGSAVAVVVPAALIQRFPRKALSAEGLIAGVFDRNGAVVAVGEDASGDEADQAALTLARFLRDDGNAAAVAEDQGVIAGLARSEISGWTVVATVPLAVALAPRTRLFTALAWLGLLLFALGALLALLSGRRAARVASEMRAAAAQLGQGEVPRLATTPVREVNEVGEALAAAGIGLRERETALRENAAFLRDVLNNLLVFVGVLDPDGTLVEINEAPLRVAGLTRAEVIGRKFWECPWWQASPETARRIRKAVEDAREGKTSRFDIGARVRHGAIFVADFQIAPIRDARGRIRALVPSAIDIDDRERATAELRESAERLRLALEAGRLGSWDLDLERGVCIYSERTCDMFGVTSPVIDRREEFRRLLHPEDRDRVFEAMRRLIEDDEPYQIEFRIMRPDGGMRWISSQGLVQRDEGGRPLRVIGVHRDISVRREREEELQHNIELLRIIGETTPDLIVVKDAQARFLFVNPAMASLLGRRGAELVGATSLDGAIDEEEAAALHAADLRIMRDGQSQTIEERVTGPDGTKRIYLSTKTPMRDREGEVVGVVSVSTDITDRKRAEERQALMVRELHHRVKNSLATVQAIANSTARTAVDIDSFREAFNDRVIALARTHTLLAENSWGVIPLRELLDAELDPYGNGDGLRVAMTGPDVALPSDVALSLGMAVHELTTNALKYGSLSSPTGSIAVRWDIESEGGRRRLRFHWTERGGPPVKKPRRQGFGSRLLRHMLAGQFNGDVQMEFDPEGLRFSLLVPLVEQAETPRRAAE